MSELSDYLDEHRSAAAEFYGMAPDDVDDGFVVAYIDMAGDGAASMPDFVFEEFELSGYHRELDDEEIEL